VSLFIPHCRDTHSLLAGPRFPSGRLHPTLLSPYL
jgi:hypothetical protein